MKKILCFLAVAGTALFTSCNNDDDSGSGNNGGNEVTSITLTSNTTTIDLGDGSFSFTVTGNDQSNLTSEAEITVDDVAIEGNTWTPTETGTFNVKATYDNLTSNTIVVTVVEPETENTFTIDGTEYATDTAVLIYFGTEEESGLNTWAITAAKVSDDGESAENQAVIVFTAPQTGEELLELPSGTISFAGDETRTLGALFTHNGSELINAQDGTGVESLNLTLSSLTEPDAETMEGSLAMNYDIEMADGETAFGNYNGQYLYVDFTQLGGRSSNAASTVKKISGSRIKQNIDNYLNK